MTWRLGLTFCALYFGVATFLPTQSSQASDDDASLLQADGAAFNAESGSIKLGKSLVDADLVWTNSSGRSWNRSAILLQLAKGVQPSSEADSDFFDEADGSKAITKARAYSQVGIVQEQSGKLYILRIWVKRDTGWRLLVYQAVRIGIPPPAEPANGECQNPCETVPFEPRNEDERDVIHAYQAVERAVAASDSKSWGAHIADEFFAVTSNSDRPLDKATRMVGLDTQKVSGIAPFPLVSARMLQFGDAMVMISVQQPLHGLPLHVTRVWFKRNGEWVEAYSYQATIQAGLSPR
jgi:hypothetical protein